MVRPFGKKNFTVDVRKSIVRGHELGAHPNILATQFDCSSSQIYRILKNNRNDHLSWGPREWANHIWSDESNFNLFVTDGIQWIRRPIGSRYAPQYQSPTVKHEGGSVMVWGCFSDTSMGPLKRIVGTMERYVYEDILENTMRPWARANLGRLWVFQQDNDPKHTSGHVANWLRRRRVDLLEWPSQSPDLNPIEHMWEERKRRLKVVRASNANQKFAQLEAAWKSIPMTVVQTLLDSMPRRCQAVIDAKAYPTKKVSDSAEKISQKIWVKKLTFQEVIVKKLVVAFFMASTVCPDLDKNAKVLTQKLLKAQRFAKNHAERVWEGNKCWYVKKGKEKTRKFPIMGKRVPVQSTTTSPTALHRSNMILMQNLYLVENLAAVRLFALPPPLFVSHPVTEELCKALARCSSILSTLKNTKLMRDFEVIYFMILNDSVGVDVFDDTKNMIPGMEAMPFRLDAFIKRNIAFKVEKIPWWIHRYRSLVFNQQPASVNVLVVSAPCHCISWKKEADYAPCVKKMERKVGGFVQAAKRGFSWTGFVFNISSEVVSFVEGVKNNIRSAITHTSAGKASQQRRRHSNLHYFRQVSHPKHRKKKSCAPGTVQEESGCEGFHLLIMMSPCNYPLHYYSYYHPSYPQLTYRSHPPFYHSGIEKSEDVGLLVLFGIIFHLLDCRSLCFLIKSDRPLPTAYSAAVCSLALYHDQRRRLERVRARRRRLARVSATKEKARKSPGENSEKSSSGENPKGFRELTLQRVTTEFDTHVVALAFIIAFLSIVEITEWYFYIFVDQAGEATDAGQAVLSLYQLISIIFMILSFIGEREHLLIPFILFMMFVVTSFLFWTIQIVFIIVFPYSERAMHLFGFQDTTDFFLREKIALTVLSVFATITTVAGWFLHVGLTCYVYFQSRNRERLVKASANNARPPMVIPTVSPQQPAKRVEDSFPNPNFTISDDEQDEEEEDKVFEQKPGPSMV
uniref:DDE_3 domain-containing protein n=2 Tax=Caenorhabditis japonica TaxID=281687 RepID=A0A8R1HQT3_CAEJA